MNRNFLNKLITLLIVISISGQSVAFAQQPGQQDKIRIDYNDATGKVSFIGADPARPITVRSAQNPGLKADSHALALISPYAADFGLKNPSSELKLISADQPTGREVTHFQQTYQGVPVIAGEMIVNANDDAQLLSLSGEIAPDLNLNTTPSISPKQAQLTALELMAKSHQVSKEDFIATEPTLWIYDSRLLEPDGTPATLVWRMEVKSKGGSLPINELVLVDAKRGAIVLNFNQIDTAWATTTTDGEINSTAKQDISTPTPAPPIEVTPTPEEPEQQMLRVISTPTPQSAPSIEPEVSDLAVTTYYVDIATGNDSNACTSIGAPCQHIQETINKAASGDVINVASGTYYFSTNPSPNVLIIGKSLSIYGGWISAFTQQSGVSTLDGANTNNVLLVNSGTVLIDGFIIQNGNSGNGAGVYFYSGSLTISRTTIRNNIASGNGGGIFHHGGTLLSIINSTISGNSAGPNGNGGGIYGALDAVPASIKNSTIAYNNAKNGGGISRNNGTYTLISSIIANNTGTTSNPDCNGTINTANYNIIENNAGCTITTGSNNSYVDPLIDSSPTEVNLVHKLLDGSPAIDGGDPSFANCPSKDQLGHSRPIQSYCDIGAIEKGMKTIFISSGSNQTALINTSFALPLIVYVQDENFGPANGVQVTFSAPNSGASGTFNSSGTNNTTITTNASGIATTSIFSSNNTIGALLVTASATDYVTSQFQLSIFDHATDPKGRYVSTSGTDGANTCNSSASPCLTFANAMTRARDGDNIYVAAGIYTGSNFQTIIIINRNLNIYGGWNADFSAQTGHTTIDSQQTSHGVWVSPNVTAHLENLIITNGYTSQGAGIYNQGNLTVVKSAIINNTTNDEGGGIYQAKGTLNIRNTTISNNTARSSGGGIYIYDGSATLNNVTITQNQVQLNYGNPVFGSGLANYFNKPVTISNSIIAGNVARGMPDCSGNIISGGNNLIGYLGGCIFFATTGDLLGVASAPINAKLGNLTYNGGGTLTHALLIGSPAINAGNPATCESTDQRGVARPQDTTCDIGAYEGSISQFVYGIIKTYTSDNNNALPGLFVCDQTSPLCTNGSNIDADKAHQYALGVYQFYSTKHNRQSIDSNNMPIISSVDYIEEYNVSFQNAFWDGAQMVYGDGFSLADDVVGHELTHGVTQYESNLFYYYQSGAINESFSDVWGELYDQQNSLGNDVAGVRWLMGEDLPGGANRSMSNPPAYSDPDKMTSANYYTGPFDSGGVHTNSGINNKAAYLMVDGGTFNSKTVTALGANKTLAIYYEVQTNLLSSGADYTDLYNALYQGCLNLIGSSLGITYGDCQQVQNATDAVEMKLQPVANFNPEAPICSAGQSPNNAYFKDLETGTSGWTFDGQGRWQYDSPYGYFAHSGTHFLYADDYPAAITDTNVRMTSAVVVPANGYLHFSHAYDFESYTGDPNFYDGGIVEYSNNGGSSWNDARLLFNSNGYNGVLSNSYDNPLKGRNAFVGTSHGYISSRVNLSSLAGQPVMFRWRMALDSSGSRWGWWLDDVRIYNCVAAVNPTISSIVRADANPVFQNTSARFTVTFSEPVTGVNVGDFAITNSGLTSPSVTNVIGSGNIYTVTVNTGLSTGTLRLDLIDNDSITDADGNRLGGSGLVNGDFTSGQSYNVSSNAAIVMSIKRINSVLTLQNTDVDFAVTFLGPVTGVDTNDFELTTTGATVASITGVTGSGTTRVVTVNTGVGLGTVRLDVPASATIDNVGGSPMSVTPFTTGESYTIVDVIYEIFLPLVIR